MSRRFRICMAKGGRESARPSYGRPKLTLISREKKSPGGLLLHRPIFAGNSHFTGISQLRAGKTGSKICCTHLSYTFSESWVRNDSVGTCPKKFSHWKFSGTERFTKNFPFSRIFMSLWKKKPSACCGLNFDATDLPHSSFEPLYPKLFRGTPEVDLVSTVWPPDLPKVRWCRYLSPRNGCF